MRPRPQSPVARDFGPALREWETFGTQGTDTPAVQATEFARHQPAVREPAVGGGTAVVGSAAGWAAGTAAAPWAAAAAAVAAAARGREQSAR